MKRLGKSTTAIAKVRSGMLPLTRKCTPIPGKPVWPFQSVPTRPKAIEQSHVQQQAGGPASVAFLLPEASVEREANTMPPPSKLKSAVVSAKEFEASRKRVAPTKGKWQRQWRDSR